jgi:hypothetical protein
MSPDAKALVIFGLLHLLALLLAGALFLILLRSEDADRRSPEDDDDSGGVRVGGIPLPTATQSDTRLRGAHDRLAEPGRRRVRTRTPAEPARRRITS